MRESICKVVGELGRIIAYGALAAAAVLALVGIAGCGSGGGGGGQAVRPAVEEPVLVGPDPVVQPAPPTASRTMTLTEGAALAAVNEPVSGSLHQSSLDHVGVMAADFLLGEETAHSREVPHPDGIRMHYFDHTYRVDLDGDGEPEHTLTVAEDSHAPAHGSDPEGRGSCGVGGPYPAKCQASALGRPDGFLMFVQHEWEDRIAHPDEALTWGWWMDRDAGHVGVFWSGAAVDRPRPLDTPLHGTLIAPVVTGVGVTGDGDVVHVGSSALLRMDVDAATVTMELGNREAAQVWNPARQGGIQLTPYDPTGFAGLPHPDDRQDTHIPGTWTYRESYLPGSPTFGVGEGQMSHENDVVSGNGEGQLGGVITTWKGEPTVFGTAGLTGIEGHEGLSLMMQFNARPDGEQGQ